MVSPPAMIIRAATPADAAAILQAHRESILVLGMEAYSLAEVESWAAGLVPERYAMNEGGETAAAGDLVGFCSFKDDEVKGLYVAPSAARRGVGSAMLRQAEAAIAAVGHRAVPASGPPSRARRSMSATGYRVVERRDWRTRGGLVIPVVDMEKMLSP